VGPARERRVPEGQARRLGNRGDRLRGAGGVDAAGGFRLRELFR
jgi:hypothetical protein